MASRLVNSAVDLQASSRPARLYPIFLASQMLDGLTGQYSWQQTSQNKALGTSTVMWLPTIASSSSLIGDKYSLQYHVVNCDFSWYQAVRARNIDRHTLTTQQFIIILL